jgi:hypothetical protein
LRTAYSDILDNIDVKAQQKAANEVQYVWVSAPSWCNCRDWKTAGCVVTAEKRLVAGDSKWRSGAGAAGAGQKIGDSGRALFTWHR